MMQDLVGIVRDQREMQQALTGLQELDSRAARAGVTGHRESTAAGTRRWTWAPADRVGSDRPVGNRTQGEPRRAFPR